MMTTWGTHHVHNIVFECL